MATNRTPLEALSFAKRFIKNFKIDDSDLKIRILNAASNRLHLFAPWDWSIAQLSLDSPEIANGTSTYAYTAASPDDYFKLIRAQVYSSNSNRAGTIKIVHSLPSQDRHNGTIEQIARIAGQDNVRVYPTPQYDSSDLPDLDVWYKLTNYEIVETGATGRQANDDSATGLLFPDEWFWVYEELVLLYALRFSDDIKAGSASISDSGKGQRIELTGQQAIAREALLFMASKEEMLLEGVGEVSNG